MELTSDRSATPPLPLDAVIADSPAQFCTRIGIAKSKFYELVQAGRLRVTKLGRLTRVPRNEILRVVAALDAGDAL